MSAGGTQGSAVGGTDSPGADEGGAPSGGAGADHSGQAGAPEPVGDGCEDLDEDGTRDCEQTVAQNPRFMTNAAGWEPEPTLHQSWEPRDASNIPESGALLVRNTNTAQGVGTMLSGSRQCIAVVGQESYSVAVNTFIPNGQGEGSAGVNVWFFGSDQCEANSIGTLPVQLVSETGVWSVVRGKFSAPGGARSMHVRLVTSKPFAQPSMEALFDDVLVRHE
jgi:hypothetical protein